MKTVNHIKKCMPNILQSPLKGSFLQEEWESYNSLRAIEQLTKAHRVEMSKEENN